MEIQGQGSDRKCYKGTEEWIWCGRYADREFWSKQLLVLLRVLACNIFDMKKYLVLPEGFRKRTIKSIKWVLKKVAGKIVEHGRGMCLKLYTEVEKFIFLRKISLRFLELAG